jgi:hypothetical protein
MDFEILCRGNKVLEGGVRGERPGDVLFKGAGAEVGSYLGEEVGFKECEGGCGEVGGEEIGDAF